MEQTMNPENTQREDSQMEDIKPDARFQQQENVGKRMERLRRRPDKVACEEIAAAVKDKRISIKAGIAIGLAARNDLKTQERLRDLCLAAPSRCKGTIIDIIKDGKGLDLLDADGDLTENIRYAVEKQRISKRIQQLNKTIERLETLPSENSVVTIDAKEVAVLCERLQNLVKEPCE
ncbi:MAG: hypothetical protein LUE23_08900 [Lachnospiraceae bacterium]|nr:hypothetical protein [Lachnospiraceae bacterium]